jgi:hypothetical protein
MRPGAGPCAAAVAGLGALVSQLATKADNTTVVIKLAAKADTATVTSQLAAKADTSAVNTQLAAKADMSRILSKSTNEGKNCCREG